MLSNITSKHFFFFFLFLKGLYYIEGQFGYNMRSIIAACWRVKKAESARLYNSVERERERERERAIDRLLLFKKETQAAET